MSKNILKIISNEKKIVRKFEKPAHFPTPKISNNYTGNNANVTISMHFGKK